MLLQQKSAQMGNNLAEQQVNNNNKAKTKLQTQEQLSSPLSQVLKTYDFCNFENCDNIMTFKIEVHNMDACICKLARLARIKNI